MANPFVEDWRAALVLHERLSDGTRLQPSGIEPGTGQGVFATRPARLELMQGVALALSTSDPTTHAAARQWRSVANGTLVLTAPRLHISAPPPGVSLGWSGLTRLYADDRGLVLEYADQRFRLCVHCPNWLLVMVFHVGFGSLPTLKPPDWVLRELAR